MRSGDPAVACCSGSSPQEFSSSRGMCAGVMVTSTCPFVTQFSSLVGGVYVGGICTKEGRKIMYQQLALIEVIYEHFRQMYLGSDGGIAYWWRAPGALSI
jgi:hypothetical protein